MPWWSVVVIWACLVLALVAVLVISAVRLFRKAVAVFDELGALAQRAEIGDAAADEGEEQHAQLAILQSLSAVHAHHREVREAALARRVARHAGRLARGRALTRVDPNSRRWFPAD